MSKKYNFDIVFSELDDTIKDYIDLDSSDFKLSEEIGEEIKKLKEIYDQSEEIVTTMTKAQ